MGDDWEDDDWSGSAATKTSAAPVNTNSGSGRGKPSNIDDDWGDSSVTKTSNGGDDWGDDNGSSGFTKSFGGGGRGGGGGGCHNCGENGHFSRECTQPRKGGGGGGGPRKCFNCQQEGHNSRDCTEPAKERPSRACFNCGSADHMSRECTEPKKSRPMTCYNCQQEGHGSRDCTEPKKSRPMTCYNCQQEGHTSRDCTEPKKGGNFKSNNNSTTNNDTDWGTDGTTSNTKANDDDFDWGGGASAGNDSSAPKGGGGGGGSGCRKCGEDGHFARECPQGGGGGGGNECRRCKKEGHKAADCTEEVLGEDGKPLPPPYKPDVIDENSESLYETIPTGINFDKYDKIKVNVSGSDPPKPISSFDECIKSQLISEAIEKCKYTRPTPVQKYAIPIIAGGRDLMACAQTGSGKTAAFVLPILQQLLSMPDLPSLYGQAVQEPLCVIISPTRELAIQIHTEAVKFAKGSLIKPCLIYGGTSSGFQMAHISRGAHFLVATPGRLLDFLTKGKISFSGLKFLVLDEADRMIDQGFLPEVRRMVTHETMPAKESRQTLMFSATFPEEIQRLAQEFLRGDYIFISIGIIGAANSDVEQTFVEVEGKAKRSKLMEILKSCDSTDRTMIFVEKKKTADFIASYLSQNQFLSTSIHGDRFQAQREKALYDFRSGRMPILVATSVAARGLDIKDVKHVINYDLPKEIDEYVHRIGRTGRVGNIGKATSFFDPSNDQDTSLTASLIKVLGEADQSVPEFLTNSSSGVRNGYGGADFGGTDCRPTANTTTNDDEGWD